ncbi:hypothetical protein D3C78_1074420 [compost metagenome]
MALLASRDEQALEALLARYNMTYTKSGGIYQIESADLSALLELAYEHKSSISQLELKKGTLNDVFLELTGKDIRG